MSWTMALSTYTSMIDFGFCGGIRILFHFLVTAFRRVPLVVVLGSSLFGYWVLLFIWLFLRLFSIFPPECFYLCFEYRGDG